MQAFCKQFSNSSLLYGVQVFRYGNGNSGIFRSSGTSHKIFNTDDFLLLISIVLIVICLYRKKEAGVKFLANVYLNLAPEN